MSVAIMSMVFDRYPVGGGEMLLALALADHAHADGTHIFPAVAQLSEKTRQSVRTVQYQLRRMQDAGWLVLTNAGHGGRCLNNEYRINPDWIKGADIAPFVPPERVQSDVKGANSAPFSASKRVQSGAQKGAKRRTKGCNGLHPHITVIREPSIEPSVNTSARVRAAPAAPDPDLSDIPSDVLDDFRQLRKAKRAPLTPSAVAGLRREADKAGIPLAEALALCCTRGWVGFKAEWIADRPRGSPGHAADPPWRIEQKNLIAEHFPNIAAKSLRPALQVVERVRQK